MADPQKALDTGRDLVKKGYYDRALHFFRKLIDSGDPGWAALGRIESGVVLKKRGDLAGAARAYNRQSIPGIRAARSGLRLRP